MILHCSQKLAARLPGVSTLPLQEASSLGSWHGHLFVMDRRQCVMFCHDATRFVLFLPGLRKAQFNELGSKGFRELYTATLAMAGCTHAQLRKAELALGEVRFDTASDRSVQGSLRIAKQDLEAYVSRAPNVLDVDPAAAACWLNKRPARMRDDLVWPDRAMREAVAAL